MNRLSTGQLVALGGVGILSAAALWRFLSRSPRHMQKSAVISKLVIYPIKSCKGIEVTTAECTALGLVSGELRDR